MVHSPLVGSVLERKPLSKPSAPSETTSTSGFPTVQHRSQSAFARARGFPEKRPNGVPLVQSSLRSPPSPLISNAEGEGWRAQVEEENRRRVEAMSNEERQQEKDEIFDKFGPGIAQVLMRAREAREAKHKESTHHKVGTEIPSSNAHLSATSAGEEAGTLLSSPSRPRHEPHTSVLRPASPPTSTSSTRPPSRSERKVRFANLAAHDIHVYESAPPSPRKKVLALPAPSASDDQVVSLGVWKPPTQFRSSIPPAAEPLDTDFEDSQANSGTIENIEAGTPEDIRRRYFPAAPANDPSLEWMQGTEIVDSEGEPSSSAIRFDLTGSPIPAHLSKTLPTHLGLHHHAEGSHAGYTIEDIFLLSRSTVPAQRASMLGVLAKIAHKLAQTSVDKRRGVPELAGQELALRKRMLAAGAEGVGERATVGARAIELLWECTAQWDEDVQSVDDVELKDVDRDEALTSIPLDYLLPQISDALARAELPNESLSQLLAILHRLAQHSNQTATEIVGTKGLISSVFQQFLLKPIPPTNDSSLPEPRALRFLRLLAASSRDNARALLDPADSLLRFVINLPTTSPYSLPLATQLLTETLDLYTIFASYGLYAHVATTAQEYFLQLSKYIRSADCQSPQLRNAWLRVLEAWIVCAHDPHSTTPSHDILWSQVVGWGWAEDMLEMRAQLSTSDEETWARLWSALAAFLEGAKVNGVRGGEEERAKVLGALKDDFATGVEKQVVELALKAAKEALGKLSAGMRQGILASDVPSLRNLGRHAATLANVIRLFIACLPEAPGDTLDAPPPPFVLPLGDLSSVCAAMTTHPLWASLHTPESILYGHLLCRPLSALLAFYLQLSRKIPGTSPDLWMAQAFAILGRLFPGDEAIAEHAITNVAEAITSTSTADLRGHLPEGGMDVIVPFLSQSLRAKGEQVVGPTWATPQSIATATTQRLPPLSSLQPNDKHNYPLPLTRDWVFCPLDHLLRSGESDVFKNLPDSWDASEAEVVRSTLLFALVSQKVLRDHRLDSFLMSREEVVFGCMKVFMLEHDQQGDNTEEEVFRDTVVGRFMTDLLAPFSAQASPKTLIAPPPSIHTPDSIDVISKRFLGSTVPFYQWYTDFVGLYDAISFAHPLFARLLLPPLSMRYPVDYRKYLWVDFNHVLRTIRTAPEDVVTGSIPGYLWPAETDAELVGAYLRALLNGALEGFVRLVAVHHIACAIWPDLGSSGEEKAQKLLRAVLDQGGVEAVRDVVLYHQIKQGVVMLPPACFQLPSRLRNRRLEFVGKCGGDAIERLKNLLGNG